MSKSVLRRLFVVAVLFSFALLGALATSQPALADGPTQGARIHRTTEWYQQHASARSAGSGNLQYYGGQVMLTAHNYTIYWVPSGYTVASGYQSLINRYFGDIGGSTFYNIVTQYYQNATTPQFIQNSASLAGTILDTSPYPGGRGTAANPLTDADIQAEVAKIATAQGWVGNTTNMFFVYTAKGVESCYDSSNCTPGTAHPAYCAYHGYFTSGTSQFIYANMPYDETWTTSCRSFFKSPNNNMAADSEISTTSHEQFEAVTDLNPPPLGPIPGTTAWTDTTGYEIGDKCAYTYGTKAKNGGNLTLNGHSYIIQLEWSNAISGCAKSY